MKHEQIVRKLTLEQKCALLTGATAFGTRAIPSAGILALEFSDGPHGLRHQSEGANHLGIGGSDPATCYPTAVTLADTWDTQLVQQVGSALGQEAAVEGVNVLLGPGVCIKRSPLCGRDFEYYSEDPYLAGKMAAAYVRGVQSQGVGACVKHFAANSQETRRQASDSVLDERTLREIYLQAFEIVVREAHPAAIMSSYNLINGTYANENTHVLHDILRDEWGFEGAVVTDWGGSNDHVEGVRAGSTFEMPACGLDSVRELVAAVKSGRLDEVTLDQRVDEAVELVLSTHDAVASAGDHFDEMGHHALARKAAAEGIVLMKNDAVANKASGVFGPLLPLAAGTRVALVGDFAKTPRYQGAGSSLVNCTKLDTLLDVVRDSDLDLVGYEPGFARDGQPDDELATGAAKLAQSADAVVCCLGLSEAAESEGLDRSGIELAANQLSLLCRLLQANPRVVVLLSCGSVVRMDWAKDVPAVAYLGLGGQAGASAALDVLTGAVNPSGKLAETWPVALGDTPCADIFPSDEFSAQYREGVYVGYRYYQTVGVPVAYPFGYGLSYTSYSYANLQVSDGGSQVSFDVTNEGQVAGAEVAQVYVGLPHAKVWRPAHQLAGFARVQLEPGQTRRVTVQLSDRAYSYFNVRTNAWEVEGGDYVVAVGGSSVDLPLKATVHQQGTGAPDPYEGLKLSSYRSGDVRHVDAHEFEELLGHQLPSDKVTLDRNLCFRDVSHGRSPIFWIVGAVLRVLVKKTDANGRPNLNALFVYNMPMRALAKNAGEFIGMGMVDAIVREIRGWGLIGIIPALVVKLLTGKHFLSIWFLWFIIPPLIEFIRNQVLNARGRKLLERQDAEAAGK